MTPEEKIIYILRATLRDLPNERALQHIARTILASIKDEVE